MDLKLNVQKRGLSTTAETINEEYTLRYGHIFRGPKGDSGEKGEKGETGAKGDNGKSPKISDNGTWLVYSDELKTFVDTGIKASGSDNNYTDADKALVQTIPNKVDKVEGKGLSANDFTDEYKQNVEQNTADIKTKQSTLTLTTKSNGNIVIGNLAGQSKEFMPATPSGDPMHYTYEAVGATWNAGTGYWKMYTLTDVTNEQMRAAVARGVITCGDKQPLSNSYRSLNGIRFNLARTGNYTMYLGGDSAEYYAYANETIEVINLTFYKNLGSQYDGSGLQMASLNHSFSNCPKLRQILGKILSSSSSINTTNAFKGCASLEDLRLAGLGGNISFADSPHLSKESLLYMINNCASGVSFTITLHPDVYAKCTSPDAMSGEWENDVYNAIEDMLNEKDSSITLASA